MSFVIHINTKQTKNRSIDLLIYFPQSAQLNEQQIRMQNK